MTDKSNFTPDEWKLLLEGVAMAGIASLARSNLWRNRHALQMPGRLQVAHREGRRLRVQMH